MLLTACIKGQKKDVAIVGAKESVVYCLDQQTGQLYWHTHLNGPSPCGFQLNPTTFVPGSAITGINTQGCTDGKLVYFSSFYSGSGIANSVGFTTPTGDSLPVTDFFALNACNGKIAWRSESFRGTPLGAVTYSNGIVWGSIVRGTFTDDETPITSRRWILRAFDAKNGKLFFELPASSEFDAVAAVTKGKSKKSK